MRFHGPFLGGSLKPKGLGDGGEPRRVDYGCCCLLEFLLFLLDAIEPLVVEIGQALDYVGVVFGDVLCFRSVFGHVA